MVAFQLATPPDTVRSCKSVSVRPQTSDRISILVAPSSLASYSLRSSSCSHHPSSQPTSHIADYILALLLIEAQEASFASRFSLYFPNTFTSLLFGLVRDTKTTGRVDRRWEAHCSAGDTSGHTSHTLHKHSLPTWTKATYVLCIVNIRGTSYIVEISKSSALIRPLCLSAHDSHLRELSAEMCRAKKCSCKKQWIATTSLPKNSPVRCPPLAYPFSHSPIFPISARHCHFTRRVSILRATVLLCLRRRQWL